MHKRLRIFGILVAVGVIACTLLSVSLPALRASLARRLLFGEPLIEVASPRPAQVLGQGGVRVLIRFPVAHRTAVASLRCLLNGIDVTSRLTLADNGATGSLWARRDGDQTLRVEVFGRTWWGGAYYEDSVEFSFEVRRNPSLDRA